MATQTYVFVFLFFGLHFFHLVFGSWVVLWSALLASLAMRSTSSWSMLTSSCCLSKPNLSNMLCGTVHSRKCRMFRRNRSISGNDGSVSNRRPAFLRAPSMTLSIRIFSNPNCLRRSSDEIRFRSTAVCSRIRLRAASPPSLFGVVFGNTNMAEEAVVGERPPLDDGGVGGAVDCCKQSAVCS